MLSLAVLTHLRFASWADQEINDQSQLKPSMVIDNLEHSLPLDVVQLALQEWFLQVDLQSGFAFEVIGNEVEVTSCQILVIITTGLWLKPSLLNDHRYHLFDFV